MNKRSFCWLISVLCLLVQLFLYTGCSLNAYKFDQEKTNIKRIEIVEANYSFFLSTGTQNTLVVIDDIDHFVDEIRKINYEGSISGPEKIEKRTLAVKVSYKNGDYEVFDSNNKSSVIRENEGVYRGRIFGFFDDEFYDLLFDYLKNVKNCRYNYMNDPEKISLVEVVKTNAKNNMLSYESLAIINDCTDFIDELNAIDYIYINDDICNGVYDYKDLELAIRIEYENGDYEIFTYNHRDEVQVMGDGEKIYRTGTYIGTFDKKQFDELIEKYVAN